MTCARRAFGTWIFVTLVWVFGAACHAPPVLDALAPEDLIEKDCVFTPLFFDGNSIILSRDSLSRMKVMGACIRSASRSVKLSGHTDRMGSRAHRQDIGRKRALAAKKEFVRLGVIAPLITTTSYGSSRMACTGEPKRCAALNRRVTIELQ